MEDKTPQRQSTGGTNNSFLKGMAKDYNDTFVGEGVWTHARNAVNNSHDGQVGVIGNEPSTFNCITLPIAGASVIGATHVYDDVWVVFSTNDIDSEIGLFDESQCTYKVLVNDKCLNFKRTNLITAANRAKYDCGTLIYWDDGLNPTRSMDIDNIPWVQSCTTLNGCTTCVDTNVLDCEKIRIAPLITHPCITIERGTTAGTLPNGSYQACIAYTINQVRVTDYIGLSEVQGLFTHENVSSSLVITVEDIDTRFDEFELVILSNINAQTVAKRIGFYNTSQGTIYVDRWDPDSTVNVPVLDIVVRTEPIEKSDALYSVGDYLMRTGIYSKFKFNYQPLANRIRVKWTCVEYPQDYYIRSNNNVGYLRDEQYAFFIRFVYNTGEFSDSYHIPGRPPLPSDTVNAAGGDAFEALAGIQVKNWQVQNTASVTTPSNYSVPLTDGGVIIAKGDMGYWESTELYPSDRPDIWNSDPTIPGSALNLCGQPIRHHKMPDETVPSMPALFSQGGDKVRLLGVEFENILCPIDNNGNPIASIVGYEILRGSREGNKTILAKGLINNMMQYPIPGSTSKGLYQNYPYNDLRDDYFLTDEYQGSTSGPGLLTPWDIGRPLDSSHGGGPSYTIYSFHSPDTSFSNPFLNPYDVKVYGTYWGESTGQFQYPYRHPRHKFLTNISIGLIDAVATVITLKRLSQLSDDTINQPDFEFTLGANDDVNVSQNLLLKGKELINYGHQHETKFEFKTDSQGGNGGNATSATIVGGATANGGQGGNINETDKAEGGEGWWNPFGGKKAQGSSTPSHEVAEDEDRMAEGVKGRADKLGKILPTDPNLPASTSTTPGSVAADNKDIISGSLSGQTSVTGVILSITAGVLMEQTLQEQLYKLVMNLIPFVQYALQYNSYGFYNNFIVKPQNERRREIVDAYYVGPTIQQYNPQYQVNNLNRSRIVVFDMGAAITAPAIQDTSRITKSKNKNPLALVTGIFSNSYEVNESFQQPISGHYGAMKIAMPSQYGQLERIKQIPISTCVFPINSSAPAATTYNTRSFGPLWGGDIYVNRFTEKNSMFFFNNWQQGEPDGTDIDYTNYHNIPFARFWINSTNLNNKIWQAASKYRSLDDHPWLDITNGQIFYVNRGYFYLFNSGVRDFFVESEVNTAYRDWEEEIPKRHYDPYRFTDVSQMFRADIIQSGNYYKYDYSLSISKLVGSHITWGNILPRDYDPLVAQNCYTYDPNSVIYSLPVKDETPKKDGWSIFRTNNRKAFISPVSSIKAINKTGAIFMLKNASPLSFMGVEELKLDGTGAKITIGDGKLFETGQNQLQSLVNTEDSFEYGSNQSRYSAINTTYGLFWISQSAGKVFNYGGEGLQEISKSGMRWWFAKYLPSELLKAFPTYKLFDNPVIGVGTQMMFDPTYELIYIAKKDYKPKYPIGTGNNQISLDSDLITFKFNGQTIQLTDSRYFENAGFTISYDPKLKAWLSFHDWKPSFMLPGRNHFMSIAKAGSSTTDTIWKHNIRCDSYCNFYGIDYPFEIEFVSSTGQTVTSMRSIEYLLEAYTVQNDCRDKFHVLDQNFDQAIIYNSEQISGVLQLVLKAKNDPLGMLTYPQINPNSISIQFSKEENKYRFNQFWDVTKNRGEFPPGFNLPMFVTSANGYEYPINPLYVDYNKSPLQRKKFRHHANKVFLRKVSSGPYKFLFKISNQKLLPSYR